MAFRSSFQPMDVGKLASALQTSTPPEVTAKLGAEVYERAARRKCHRFGMTGAKIGRDLTRNSTRRQRKEILRAILYPSLHLHEDYPSVLVLTRDGQTWHGMLALLTQEKLMLLSPEGKTLAFAKVEIEEIMPQKTSAMPSGLLDTLSLEEIAALLCYLELTP